VCDRSDILFHGNSLYDVLYAAEQNVQAAVDRIAEAQLRSNSDEQITAHIVSEMTVEPLVIFEDRMQATQTEGKIDVSDWPGRNHFRERGPIHVPSIRVTVTLPYAGEAGLWTLKPSTWGGTVPYGRPSTSGGAGSGVLTMTVELPADSDPNDFKRHIDAQVQAIRNNIGYQQSQLVQFNSQLASRAQAAIAKRRQRLGKAADVLKVLNIPLAPKPGAPDVSQLPIRRKMVVPLAPASVGEKSYQVEDAVYEHILGVIRHEGATFETTRETYINLGEEDLRNIILAHLNGHYEGDAKGEAFRGAGKTDVTIERENRAAFVAECKLWKGDKQMAAAIDQLLGYLTWRDGKTALVLFNKDVAGFADTQAKVPELVKAHPRFVSALTAGKAGEWRFRFKSKDDDGRLVTVHVFLFNLFVTKDRR
jgi:hypothetical protein